MVETATATFGAGPEAEAARQQFIGETYGSYFSYINLIGFLLQAFVVSRVFKFVGVGRALFIHPTIALSSYLLMLRAPSFEAIRFLKTADNSISYSLGNTTMQALWLPTSRETKYKAKQAVDSFCVRAGDVLQAGVVYAGELTSAVGERLRGGQRLLCARLARRGGRPERSAALAGPARRQREL